MYTGDIAYSQDEANPPVTGGTCQKCQICKMCDKATLMTLDVNINASVATKTSGYK